MAFDTSAFFSPSFDVMAWISEQVGPLPREIVLEQLRNELARYQAELKAELVSTVNKDYAGFVHVASKMEGFATAINRLKPPLVNVYDRLRAIHIAVDDKLRQLRDIAAKRAAIREAKALLQDCVRAQELVDKIDAVLKQTEGGAGDIGTGTDVETLCSRFLRLGNWFRELRRLQDTHGALPFFMMLQPRITVCCVPCCTHGYGAVLSES